MEEGEGWRRERGVEEGERGGGGRGVEEGEEWRRERSGGGRGREREKGGYTSVEGMRVHKCGGNAHWINW